MEDIKKRIADMTRGMDFDRKPRATKKEKEDYAALAGSAAAIKRDVDKHGQDYKQRILNYARA